MNFLKNLTSSLLDERGHGGGAGGERGGGAGQSVENVVLHRNQLETAALSTAAVGGAAWTILRRILDPDYSTSITAVSAAKYLRQEELTDLRRDPRRAATADLLASGETTASEKAGAHTDASKPPGTGLSFWDLQRRLDHLQTRLKKEREILIGWRRRPREPHATETLLLKPELNPRDKDAKLDWCKEDELLVFFELSPYIDVDDDRQSTGTGSPQPTRWNKVTKRGDLPQTRLSGLKHREWAASLQKLSLRRGDRV